MPRFAANLSLMFTEIPFMERFAAAAAQGFEAVEFQFPYDFDAGAIRAELDRLNLALSVFNSPPGNWVSGERGLAALPGQEAFFRASIDQALDYARAFGATHLHVMAGAATGVVARETYINNLRCACEKAAADNVTILIEPLNTRDMPGYHLTTSDDALEVLEAVAAENLSLQLDLYHCQVMEGDLTRRIDHLLPVIGHIQIAGVPNRHEPDRGEICYGYLFKHLDELGYTGWIGCEYKPFGRTEDGLGWFQPYRKR